MRWSLSLAAWMVASGVAITAAAADLEVAQRLYDEGRYGDALPLFDALRDDPTVTGAKLVEVLKHQAFSLYLLSLHDEAKEVWQELLRVQPDFRLDTELDSPVFVSFFGRVRSPPREEPSITSRALQEPKPVPEPGAAPIRGCGVALCLVPFGVGQFANNRMLKGALLAAAQTLFLGFNIGIHVNREAQFNKHGIVPDPAQERREVVAQNVFLGLFVATAIAGVLDAFLFP